VPALSSGPLKSHDQSIGREVARAGWPELMAVLLVAGGGAGVVLANSSVGAIIAFASLSLTLRRYLDGAQRQPDTAQDDQDPYRC
jgi:hypothetical protein